MNPTARADFSDPETHGSARPSALPHTSNDSSTTESTAPGAPHDLGSYPGHLCGTEVSDTGPGIVAERQTVLDAAYAAHPERFPQTAAPPQPAHQPKRGSTTRPSRPILARKVKNTGNKGLTGSGGSVGRYCGDFPQLVYVPQPTPILTSGICTARTTTTIVGRAWRTSCWPRTANAGQGWRTERGPAPALLLS